MLCSLFIQNYAIIESLEINFEDRFSILTGETGAGKSIIFGAISLIIGERADTKSLYNSSEKCIIEGIFEIKNIPGIKTLFEEMDWEYDEECIIRREILPNGKSRAFVNDSPILLEDLKKLGERLVDIHSQQDHWWLSQPEFSLTIVDQYAENTSLIESYQKKYEEYLQIKESLSNKIRVKKENESKQDYLLFQLKELKEAAIVEEEFIQLEEELNTLENSESILEKLTQANQGLSNAEISGLELIKSALNQVQSLIKIHSKYEDWSKRIESSWIELKEIAREIEYEIEHFSLDPRRLLFVQERMDLYRKLIQKHKCQDIKELIDFRNSLENQVGEGGNSEEEIEFLTKQLEELENGLRAEAAELSRRRKEFAPEIIGSLGQSLIDLGMPNAELAWEWTEKEFGKDGIDKIQLLFSSNKGSSPKSIKQVASGGELSRIMLGIKYLMASKVQMPTLLLDEIDTGVSGEIAIKMGNMLAKMAKSHQIIAITHLPQIAAGGQSHYFVYKKLENDRTISAIKKLSQEEQLNEIAKMIGGEENYQQLIPSVRELKEQIQKK